LRAARRLPLLLGAAAAAASAALAAGDAAVASPIGAGAEPAPPWRVVGVPGGALPLPRFAVAAQDGERILRIESDKAYGNLVHALPHAKAGTLSWRWRVDQAPAGADLRTKAGDDSALKVCASFDMPLDRVPFVERQLLRLASMRTGERLPTATLCYVWDAMLAPGTLLDNAYTRRVRFIAAGGARARWHDERRDLVADFRRAFGDESPQATPPLAALLIGADSDNTATRSVAYLAALRHDAP
jgi:Protein of unknown function (DUF3047)